MPKETRLALNYELTADLSTVYNSLLDFKKFGELHPYMKQVEIINDKRPEFVEYQVKEEIYLFGFIKNHPEYTAKVFEVEKNKRIQYTSPVKKYIWLVIDFTFVENGNGSVTVQENITLTCNKLLGRVFSGILQKSHALLFEKLGKPVNALKN